MKPAILITFDSMKHPNSGLFSYGKSLGDAMIRQNKWFDLSYYLHRRAIYQFGPVVLKVFLSKLHQVFFPKRRQFKLVHFTDQYFRLNPNRVKAKKVVTIHDMNPVHEKLRSPRKMTKYLNRLGGYISACDKVVTISQFVADDIVKYYPEAAKKIAVIYNGADKLVLPADHTPAFVPESKFLFAIGHVSAKKNFHVLPALLEGNDYLLVIAGILTPYTEKIMEQAHKYNCTDRVIITGPVSEADKAWYYKNCEAFVFPSLAEGFGLPVIEAMHFGKPVFLSTHTSLPEVGGDAAYYFNTFDSAAMQLILTAGLADFKSNNRSAAVRKHADKFSWDETAKQYLQLYKDCLESITM